MKQAAKRRLRNNIGSWLILICSLLATRWAWNYSTAQAHERAQDLFDREVDRSTAALRERLAAYEDVLYGARGLFEASPTVSRTMFRDYVNGLQLGRRYPGIQAVEYVAYLTPEQKDAHVRAVRNEGFPSYSIRPPGDRSEYTAIIYVEPLNWRNQRAFGYDMLTEPVRRAALEYARDTGDTSISAKVRLVQETDKDVQAGFLMYLPLYRTGMPLDTVEQRRAALRGYFCSPFRMNDLMNGAIRERSPLASVQIFSGRAPSRDMMMYPSPSGEARAAGPPGSVLREREIQFGGQVWLLRFSSTPAFLAEIRERENHVIVPAGITLGLLLFAFTYWLSHAESRATEMAGTIQRGQEELQQSEARFRSLFQESPFGIYRVSRDGRFLIANPALVHMLGFKNEEEVLGLNIGRDVFCDPDFRERLAREYWGKKEYRDVEAQWKRRNGDRIVVRMTGRPVFHPNGQPAYFEVFVEDVTERRALERQLLQAQKMEAVGQLAGGIAHDFNNLLAVILGQVEMLITQPDLDDHVRCRAEEIEQSGKRAAALTRQLLTFSRKQMIEPRVLDVNDTVQEIAKLLRRLIGEDVELTLKLQPTSGNIKADPSQIEQILMNLAVNARDAMPHGGKLLIEASAVELDETYVRQHLGARSGSFVLLTVSDTGSGMDSSTLAHIFEPFFTTKEQGKGTGLGLATVYGIVKQNGGYITPYSEPGHGTTFKIYLPRVADSGESLEASPAWEEVPGGTETVLLAEDEPSLRRLARELLEGAGYRVIGAGNGAEAVQKARDTQQPIHLLLTDVIMPGMNGRELAEELTALCPGMRVLYMSGYADDIIADRGILSQSNILLPKPFTRALLLRKVREALDVARV